MDISHTTLSRSQLINAFCDFNITIVHMLNYRTTLALWLGTLHIVTKRMHAGLWGIYIIMFYGTRRKLGVFASHMQNYFQNCQVSRTAQAFWGFCTFLLAQIAVCFLLLFQAGHGMLPSTKKACVFLFFKNLQKWNWMSSKQASWSNEPTECFSVRIVWSCLLMGAAGSCCPYSTPPWFGLVPSA